MISKRKTDYAKGAMERVSRTAMGIVRRSPVYKWRFGGTHGDQLLIVPQDLRTVDPSFATELRHGLFGLAGAVAELREASPFDIAPPNAIWQRDLLGFSWLRHMAGDDDDETRELARQLTVKFIDRHKAQKGLAWDPVIVSRRLISWLAHARLILHEASQKEYEAILRSLNRMLRHLAIGYGDAIDGEPRLRALTGLIYGGLCIAEQDQFAEEFVAPFSDELERQILEDGGHISRHPGTTIELILDLLPLKQCFVARDRKPPLALDRAIRRALPMLRYMRLGDGLISRFNGMTATWPDRLATVLAYDDLQIDPLVDAPQSCYSRLQRRRTVLIADVGSPPPLALSCSAHAGCLSFEMSVDQHPVIVNCGAPGPADQDWRAVGRSTAAHSTMTINDKSSSQLVQRPQLENQLGAPPISGPDRVEARVGSGDDGSALIRAFHDGYVERFGMVHERSLRLGPHGDVLEGVDKLTRSRQVRTVRSAQSLIFALHFHIHPRVDVKRTAKENIIELELANGEKWQLVVADGIIRLEESVFLAEFAGPLEAVQAVVRGSCGETTEIRWRLEQSQSATLDALQVRRRRFAVIEGSRSDDAED